MSIATSSPGVDAISLTQRVEVVFMRDRGCGRLAIGARATATVRWGS